MRGQDGDASSRVAHRDRLSRWRQFVDGEAQPGAREEDAEERGDRPSDVAVTYARTEPEPAGGVTAWN